MKLRKQWPVEFIGISAEGSLEIYGTIIGCLNNQSFRRLVVSYRYDEKPRSKVAIFAFACDLSNPIHTELKSSVEESFAVYSQVRHIESIKYSNKAATDSHYHPPPLGFEALPLLAFVIFIPFDLDSRFAGSRDISSRLHLPSVRQIIFASTKLLFAKFVCCPVSYNHIHKYQSPK